MAAAFRNLVSTEYDDETKYEKTMPWTPEPPDYPPGMTFTIREPDFDELGIEDCRPGETISFAALARCTSCNRSMDGCRMEAEIDFLSLDNGEFVELSDMARPCICLDEDDHERLDLDEDSCEKGHMIHLIGTVRVEATNDPSFGDKSVSLTITAASLEDEDEEAMNG